MRKTCYCFRCGQLIKFDIKNQFNVEMGGIPECLICENKLNDLMRNNPNYHQLEKLEKE